MMDKKTILVLASCVVVIVGGQFVINKLFPPVPKPPAPARTNVVASTTTTAAVTNVAPALKPAPAEPVAPRAAEQVVALSNAFVRVEFTSWGGGIKSVELLKYKANGHGHVILNAGASTPVLAVEGLPGREGDYEFASTTATSVVLRAKLSAGATVTKQLSLGADYVVTGAIELSQPMTQPVQIAIGQAAPLHPGETADFIGVDWLGAGKYQERNLTTLWNNNVKKLYTEPANAPWGAVKNQFFALVLTPATNAVAVHYLPRRLDSPADWTGKQPYDVATATLEVPPTAGTTGATWPFALYAGPKEYKRLAALGKGQEEVMAFGMWGLISVILLQSMNFLYGIIPNYGIAIILITIAIKLIFWPIQAKSIQSMKAMQKFQPLMTKLREKYKDDPQRLNAEMMKLYKEHKINPLSGCLPMLVQIPVFFALFAMLRSAVELRGAGFLWIKDLSQPDTVFSLAGLPLNPLPLLMTGSMFWQQKLTPSSADKQQQMMMLMMPAMMLFFFYNSSSGLTLYWTVQQLLSIAQQWWSLRPPDSAAAAPGMVKPK